MRLYFYYICASIIFRRYYYGKRKCSAEIFGEKVLIFYYEGKIAYDIYKSLLKTINDANAKLDISVMEGVQNAMKDWAIF